ncbi:ssDNA binding protein [Agrobacterium phage OLIVR5]|uniref:SsDNA binding protein n=1 Tax=Agrobacterium phage OLIVR5 TaxID=2723773 RepID=A0A858MTD0_9CAUD|nr:ssDNA binding protein [Agrobacterium phage OLIVR5]QIW87849.1 ssDNA binding protein [Agrobacterium phage OLIVR5]QIW88114.1 ssDNA binding protein [Agrobacterium phage OLIVR6]
MASRRSVYRISRWTLSTATFMRTVKILSDHEENDKKSFLEKLLDSWEADAEIGNDLSSEQRRISKLHSKYFNQLIRVNMRLSELEDELEEAETKESLYLKGRAHEDEYKRRPHNLIINTKDELNLYLNANIPIRTLRKRVRSAKDSKAALEEILKQINTRSFRINGILDNEKFKAGLNK